MSPGATFITKFTMLNKAIFATNMTHHQTLALLSLKCSQMYCLLFA